VTSGGKKEFLAIEDGYRESEQSWTEVLLSLKGRGFKSPKLAVGDGAFGFWEAVIKVFAQILANVAGFIRRQTFSTSSQNTVRQKQNNISIISGWRKPEKNVEKAFDLFIKNHELKYPKAAQCLEKDREELLAFYDFPADHWSHIRTSNPIESTFSTIRMRIKKTRACVSRTTILAMVYKLGLSAEKGWRKLRGFRRLADVLIGENQHPHQCYQLTLL
jgi:putative transposase